METMDIIKITNGVDTVWSAKCAEGYIFDNDVLTVFDEGQWQALSPDNKIVYWQGSYNDISLQGLKLDLYRMQMPVS